MEQGQIGYYLLSMNEFWVRRCWAGGILQNEATRCPPQGGLVQYILSGWLSIFSFSKKTNPLPQQCTCNTLYVCWEKKNNFVGKVREKRAALCSQQCSQPSCCAWGTSLGFQVSFPEPQQCFPCRKAAVCEAEKPR